MFSYFSGVDERSEAIKLKSRPLSECFGQIGFVYFSFSNDAALLVCEYYPLSFAMLNIHIIVILYA